jgi:hypothetical protein
MESRNGRRASSDGGWLRPPPPPPKCPNFQSLLQLKSKKPVKHYDLTTTDHLYNNLAKLLFVRIPFTAKPFSQADSKLDVESLNTKKIEKKFHGKKF